MSNRVVEPGAEGGGDAAAEARIECVVAGVRDRLDEREIEKLRESTRRLIEMGRVLMAFPLQNADEPEFVFGAFRSEE